MSVAQEQNTSEATETVVAENPAPDPLDKLRDAAFSFADIAQNLSENLLRPWIAYQIAIAIGVFVVAYFLTTSLKASFQNWIRARRLTDVAYAYLCVVAPPFAFARLCCADLDHLVGEARNHMTLALLFDRDHRKSSHRLVLHRFRYALYSQLTIARNHPLSRMDLGDVEQRQPDRRNPRAA